MKEYDFVRLIKDRPEYLEEGIKKGRIGYICEPEIRGDCFLVDFIDENFYIHQAEEDNWIIEHYNEIKDDVIMEVKIEDLELYKDGGTTDEELLEDLPKNNPKWWCKVEDGYILNLLGEKKNKIPYDYNS